MEQTYKTKAGASKFRKHLRSSINQEYIEKMTNMLESELADSQKAMNQIASIFKTLNNSNNNDLSVDNLPADATAEFLEAEPLKLVPPDLIAVQFEGEVDEILASMKMYADKLKKNLPVIEPLPDIHKSAYNLEPLDVNEYAQSLGQLEKRLAYIRTNLKPVESKRDLNLESKLEILSQDIKLFKEMTESSELINKCSENSKSMPSDKSVGSNTSQFEEIVNKLLSGINDVTYLRQNKG